MARCLYANKFGTFLLQAVGVGHQRALNRVAERLDYGGEEDGSGARQGWSVVRRPVMGRDYGETCYVF